MIPAVTYQGGKQRIAQQILEIMKINQNDDFHDLCCGSGSLSIELVNQGHDPTKIYMVDQGPWGLVWDLVGRGNFSLQRFSEVCNSIPEKSQIKEYMEALSKQPADIDTPYVYLILQASSFGGKAIWIENNTWKNCSFRNLWMPTETSNRRSPVNPMMPMPDTLLTRMEEICQRMLGVHGFCININEYQAQTGIVYIDPPYKNTTHYGSAFDVVSYANKTSLPTYVSEG